jgi:hypothetical protein
VPDEDLRRCVRSVLAIGQDLDATSIAEVLWLAAAPPATGIIDRSPAAAVSDLPAVLDAARPPATQQTARLETGEGGPVQSPKTVHGAAGIPARRVRVQRAKPLPAPLGLARSLRPFKRPWPEGRRLRLDIDATVRAYARTWQLIPEFRPAPERWFEAALVIDDSPSMTVWNETVSEFATLLHQLGAFRNIRTWHMSLAGTAPTLRNEGRQPTRPDQLRAPDGRRLIIVISDGAAPGWFRPEVWQMIRTWAVSTPTALVSPLASRLWRRTGLDLPAVRAGPATPGSPNTMLRYSLPYLLKTLGTGNEEWMPLPAATLSPHMLGQWAKTLMRGDPRGCAALLIPPAGHLSYEEEAAAASPDAPAGRDVVEAFQRVASPDAARLAVLCAPFAAVSLPLLHLIRQELVPGASTGDLAEVIVGGLFLPPTPAPDGAMILFRDGVRTQLQERLAESDAWHMYEMLKRHITTKEGPRATFAAAIQDPLGNVTVPVDLQPFAAAARDTLEFLGALPDAAPVIIGAAGAADPGKNPPAFVAQRPGAGGGERAGGDTLPPRNPVFTGREDMLAEVGRRLDGGPVAVVAVRGLGGMGKSHVALEYAHRMRGSGRYRVAGWVRADSAVTAAEDLAAMAPLLGLAADGPAGEVAASVVAALGSRRDWLVVFDNAQRPGDLAGMVPGGGGHVLITSRNWAWSGVASQLNLEVFSRAESVAFLCKRSGCQRSRN